jgi:hypothetical protein
LCCFRNKLKRGQCCTATTAPTIPPDNERIAYVAVRIPTAVWKATDQRPLGRLRRLVATHNPILASPPKVPAKKPASAPFQGPCLMITPATSPATNGPISGEATPMIRLMRNPTPIASKRSPLVSGGDWELVVPIARSSLVSRTVTRFRDILLVTPSKPIWLHSNASRAWEL